MGLENIEAIKAFALWAALNFGLMMALAFNVFRWRSKESIAVGLAQASTELERAVRAHGNNTEYVPSILLGLLVLALLGESALMIHIAGAILLVSRLLHAQGIQQTHTDLPIGRVLGNVICWLLYIVSAIRMFILGIS